MQTINNKTILITGASQGIGEAIAYYFADKGASVVLAARNINKLNDIVEKIKGSGGNAIAVVCDVSQYADVKAAVDQAIQHYATLDILVNNAGLIEPIARIVDSDVEQWTKVADVNYKGVYYGLRAAIPEMLKANQGTIINISSGAATSALEGWSHYCSSKAAALSLTRCADKEYAQHGIRVLGLSPGTVATEMQVAIRQSGINPVSQLDPAVHIPADWVAKAVEFLCTEAGAEFAGGDFVLRKDENRRLLGLPMAPT